jgi:hypothetical protein
VADVAISIVVFVFALTIIPMIVAGTVVPVWTSIPMVAGAIVLTIAYISLGLWLSVAVEAISAVLWAIIARRSFA